MANFHSYEYNTLDWYDRGGSFTWTKPDDIDDSKPILVHVWGAGGTGGTGNLSFGGGGGGLAVKLIDVSALGATETVTVGATADANSQAGASSFGSHCSATGGNGGTCTVENPSGDTSNNLHGNAGIGVGGDVNKRGGRGGGTYYSSASNCGGGGGGSAPAPYGVSVGFVGGNGATYAGGGGGGIGGNGKAGAYVGGTGGGTTSSSQVTQSPSSYYTPMPGGNGFAAAGAAGSIRYAYTTYGDGTPSSGVEGQGQFIINPNQIFMTGGGGAGGMEYVQSTYGITCGATGGGPGAGGGGGASGSGRNYTQTGASGGILGGGGGAAMYSGGGQGGLAAGGGAVGYSVNFGYGMGGCGLVILQYARKV